MNIFFGTQPRNVASSSSTPPAASSKRVIVIGAGWAGLAAAKTYLEVDPSINLTIIDSERTVGGVWSKERIYPGLQADSPVGLFEFSDLAMRDAIGLEDWKQLPGEKVYEYMHAYAEKFSLLERCRFQTTVSNVSRNKDGKAWDIKITNSKEVLTCDKLIISTGLHSNPRWPDVPTVGFSGLIIHSKDIGVHYDKLASETIKRVTIYGGCKSAIEAVSMCLDMGKKVDWVIRENGTRVLKLIEPEHLKGLRANAQATAPFQRFSSAFTPSVFKTHGLCRQYLHCNNHRFSNWYTGRILHVTSMIPNSRPSSQDPPNIQKLKPEITRGSFYPTLLYGLQGAVVSGKFIEELYNGSLIQVHRATIKSCSASEVELSNDENISSDAVVFATGYEPQSPLFSAADALTLGLSTPLPEKTETVEYWDELGTRAEKELRTMPAFQQSEQCDERDFTTHKPPHRLYRHIVPSALAAQQDRSLVFVGFLTSERSAIYSEVAALWGVAWLDGLLDLPTSKEEMDYHSVKVDVWARLRYPSYGSTHQIPLVEMQHIVDMLMEDMGLTAHRLGFYKSAFQTTHAHWYIGIIQELLAEKRRLGCTCVKSG